MPDIYVMNDAISYGISVLILGIGVCVAFVTGIEWLRGRKR